MTRALARLLRTLADRIDHAGAPKRMTSLGVALVQGVGWELRQDGTGVPIWYYGDDDYNQHAWEPRTPTRVPITWERIPPSEPCSSPDGHDPLDTMEMNSEVPVNSFCSRCGQWYQILVVQVRTTEKNV